MHPDKPKISSRPPVPQSADDFIAGAEKPKQPVAEKPTKKDEFPWEKQGVRSDVVKNVNLRLPEPLYLKLQYVSEKTRKSQQELIREYLMPGLERELKQIKD